MNNFNSFFCSAAILLFSWINCSAQVWTNLSTGIPDEVNVIKSFGADLIVGGDFHSAGSVSANYLAKWDGTTWSAFSDELDGQVFAMHEHNGELYVAGQFTHAGGLTVNNIAKWNGTTWSALGEGLNGDVNALAIFNGELYAGGGFFMSGSTLLPYIARFDGSNWQALGSGTDGAVYCIAAYQSELFVGGSFNSAGGIEYSQKIAKWNGADWDSIGLNGTDGTVLTMELHQNDLYLGGNFNILGVMSASKIARWDGNFFSSVGTIEPEFRVNDLLSWNDDLYVGGSFDSVLNCSCHHVARWNLQQDQWTPLGNGLGGWVNSLEVYNNVLFAAGSFPDPEGNISTAVNIARWTPGSVTIDNIGKAEFELFPNPSSGAFTIQSPNEIKEIIITDLLGKQILKSQVNQYNQTISLPENGVYFVQVKSKLGSSIKKIVLSN